MTFLGLRATSFSEKHCQSLTIKNYLEFLRNKCISEGIIKILSSVKITTFVYYKFMFVAQKSKSNLRNYCYNKLKIKLSIGVRQTKYIKE